MAMLNNQMVSMLVQSGTSHPVKCNRSTCNEAGEGLDLVLSLDNLDEDELDSKLGNPQDKGGLLRFLPGNSSENIGF